MRNRENNLTKEEETAIKAIKNMAREAKDKLISGRKSLSPVNTRDFRERQYKD